MISVRLNGAASDGTTGDAKAIWQGVNGNADGAEFIGHGCDAVALLVAQFLSLPHFGDPLCYGSGYCKHREFINHAHNQITRDLCGVQGAVAHGEISHRLA